MTVETEPMPTSTNNPGAPRPSSQPDPMSQRLRSLSLREGERIGVQSKVKRKPAWRYAIIPALLVLLIGGGYAFATRHPEYRTYLQQLTKPAVVEVAAVKLTEAPSAEAILDTTGNIVARNKVQITPIVAGTIAELFIEEGQKVKKGDVLARLDDTRYKSDLDQAKAALALAKARLRDLEGGAREEEIEQARAILDQAKARHLMLSHEAERARQLGDTISPADLERSETGKQEAAAQVRNFTQALKLLESGPREEKLAAARADVDNAEALVAKAEWFYSNTRVTAPISGTILEKKAEVGEMIRPESIVSSGALCSIADLTHMEAQVDIQERDMQRLKPGQPCRITIEAYADHEYEGKLLRLQPMVNRQRGVIETTIEITNPDDQLLPDMNCRAVFLPNDAQSSQPALRIPKAAVRTDGSLKEVFVLDGDVARKRPVVLGTAQGESVAVVQGLASGDVVLMPGDKKLAEGQTVKATLQ